MPGKKNNEQTSKETNTVMCFLFGNFWLKKCQIPTKKRIKLYLFAFSIRPPTPLLGLAWDF